MKKKILLALTAMVISFSLAACESNSEKPADNQNQSTANTVSQDLATEENGERLSGKDVVVSFQGRDFTVAELYCRFIVYAYTNSVTSENMNDVNIEYILIDLVKNAQIEFAEYNKALEAGVSLSDTYKASSDEQAKSFISFMGPSFMEKYDIDEQTVYDYFQLQTVVSLYMNDIYTAKYDELLPEYQEKYADYEFEKVYRALFSYLAIDGEGNVTVDSNGNYAVYDDEKKAEIYKNAEKLLSELNEDSSNLEELITTYGIEESSGVDYIYKGEAEDEISLAVRDLEAGEHTGIITTDMGYAIIRIDNTNDLEIKEAMLSQYASDEAKQYVEDCMSDIKTEIYLDMEEADAEIKSKIQILDILKTLEANDFGY